MFCSNCGKTIADDAKFCNFCGLPVKMASAPVSPLISVMDQPVSMTDRPISQTMPAAEQTVFETEEPIAEASAVVEAVENTFEPISEPAQESESAPITLPEPANTEPMYSAPTPESIPNMGAIPNPTIPGTAAPMSQPIYQPPQPNPQFTPRAPERPLPERKYTLGHIIMCLSAVAIMAIVAGVFAGLYFSVI